MTLTGSVTLTDTEREALEQLASEVRGPAAREARDREDTLWASLISRGVTKTSIAEASGVTIMAITSRLRAK